MEKIEVVDASEIPPNQVEGDSPLSPGLIDIEAAKKLRLSLVDSQLPEDQALAEAAYGELKGAYLDLANGIIQAVESGKVAFGTVE